MCRNIRFIYFQGGSTDIELVKPYEQNLSMQKMLKKRGVSPYHLCYEVDDVEAIYKDLTAKEGWLPLFKPVPAVAFGNRAHNILC